METYKDKIDIKRLPEHIAIIMDGNGRWAKKRGLPRTMGHRAGVKTIKTIVKECDKLGVKYLTLYAFSTENWKRPEDEVNALMKLVVEFIKNEIDELHQNGVRVQTIGDLSAAVTGLLLALNLPANIPLWQCGTSEFLFFRPFFVERQRKGIKSNPLSARRRSAV